MRIFLALDIDDSIRERIRTFTEGVRNFAPDARWAREESLHATLKFIGEFPDDKIDALKQELMTVSSPSTQIHFQGYGFFPNPKSARGFWIGMGAGAATRRPSG